MGCWRRISGFIDGKSGLITERGSTLLEMVLAIGLGGILVFGFFTITKNKNALTKKSQSDYAHLINAMTPINAFKRDVSMAFKIKEITATSTHPLYLELKINKFRSTKVEEMTVEYSNSDCKEGTRTVPCVIRTVKTDSNPSGRTMSYRGISKIVWCKGGVVPIGNCYSMGANVPESGISPVPQLSSKRFMAEFETRTTTMTFSTDMNNLFEEDESRNDIILLD